MARSLRLLLTLTALGLAAPPAAAQIDLPRRSDGEDAPRARRETSRGNLVPHLTCTVCYERNYTAAIDWSAENGLQKTWCGVCRTVRLHKLPQQGKSRGKLLDLPSGPRLDRGIAPAEGPAEPAREVAGERAAMPPAATPTPAELDPADPAGALTRAARDVLDELNRLDKFDDPVARQAADTLLSLGPAGIEAARLALASDHGPRMMTGLRVLLRSGDPTDAEQVVRRLRTRLPTRVAGQAVFELAALDPVRATPLLLTELLLHPQAPVRAAAHRALADAPPGDVLPLLPPVLDADHADARWRAVDLAASIGGPEAVDLLLEHVDDPRARVARRALTALAEMDDPRIVPELLRRAFGERWVLRPGAYALVAIAEREDRLLESILDGRHVGELLRGLDSSDPFVSGACAAALAGIGFRSDDPDASPWLDDVVPARLVEIVSGFRFFDDYEAVQATALRRLKQISGVSHGADGPAWAEWWIAQSGSFRASRAVLRVAAGEERDLRVHVRDGQSGTCFVLLAPDQAPKGAPAREGEVFYVSEAEARDLVALLRDEGVFQVERLPGARGARPDLGTTLEVSVGTRAKSFVFGPGSAEPWFERVVAVARALRDSHRWQRFPHPERHDTRLALWRAEGAWWGGDHTEVERAERLKELLFGRMLALPPAEREDGLEALEEVYADERNVSAADFAPLVKMLGEEVYYTGRADRIADLARRAAGLDGTDEAAGEALERGWELARALHDRFGADAGNALAELFAAGGDEMARGAAQDSRPLLRSVAAVVMGRDPDARDVEILMQLLEDPEVLVEIAAVEALGAARVETAREALVIRAGTAEPEVRDAALRAVGRLGGEDVREVLVAAMTEVDDRHREAAAAGLAALKDPSTVPLLLSVLRNRNDAAAFPAIRDGLLELGELAWDELFLAMRSPSPELRREASLLLARQRVPNAAPALMRALAEDPADNHVARELCVLTCVDLRDQGDPAEAWYRWWDGVRHDDALAWFRAACESRGITSPAPEAFLDGGTRDAFGFLVAVLRTQDGWLVERARRELEALLGREVGELPPPGVARDAWLAALLEVLDASR